MTALLTPIISQITSNRKAQNTWGHPHSSEMPQPFTWGNGDSTTMEIQHIQISLCMLTPPLSGVASSHKLTYYRLLWLQQTQ